MGNIMGNIKALAAIALVGGLLLGLGRMWLLSAENDYLGRRLAETERINQALATEIAAGRAALSARETERKRLADETAALKQKLNEVYDNDPETKLWADAPCPDALLECLRP